MTTRKVTLVAISITEALQDVTPRLENDDG